MNNQANSFSLCSEANWLKFQHKDKKAQVKYSRAILQDPNSYKIYIEWANLTWRQEDIQKAEEKYRKAYLVNPQSHYTAFILAELFTKQKRYAEAIAIYSEWAAKQPDLTIAYSNWADVLYQQGKYDDAIEIFQKIIATNPNSKTYSSLAWMFYNNQKYDEALQAFKQAIKIAPGKSLFHILYGIVVMHYCGENEANKIYSTIPQRLSRRLMERDEILRFLKSEIPQTEHQINSAVHNKDREFFSRKLASTQKMLGLFFETSFLMIDGELEGLFGEDESNI